MKNIIFISAEKLSPKIRRDWYINDFLQDNYNIEFWDVSSLIKSDKLVNENYEKISIQEITDIKVLESRIAEKNNESIIYAVLVTYTYEALNIYKLITKYNLFTIFFYWGEFPLVYTEKRMLSKVKNYFSLNISFHTLIKRIFQRQYVKLLRKIGYIKKYDLCFYAGDICKQLSYSKKNISVCLCDYKQNMKAKSFISNEKYSVFIDINLPYHPDTFYSYTIDDDKYFKSLNNFFNKYEKEYGIKVIIAAHPKSKYDNRTFDGREIYYLKTAELIKSCEHVFLHHSTAISYAVLNYKPMSFLITDEIINSTDFFLTKGLSDYFNKDLINIDDLSTTRVDIGKLDKELYDKYKYSYIVSRATEGTDTTKTVLESLNKYSLIQKNA
tara:strand:- start:394 stop:1545 length:1152 start_codon:yes stop_codon:yes gene_type:complete